MFKVYVNRVQIDYNRYLETYILLYSAHSFTPKSPLLYYYFINLASFGSSYII